MCVPKVGRFVDCDFWGRESVKASLLLLLLLLLLIVGKRTHCPSLFTRSVINISGPLHQRTAVQLFISFQPLNKETNNLPLKDGRSSSQ